MKKLMAILLVVLLATTVVAFKSSFFQGSEITKKARVRLCYKDGVGVDTVPGTDDDWECQKGKKVPNGWLHYSQVNEGALKMRLNVRGLDADYLYQITLNGAGDGNNDGCNTDYNNYVDGVLAGMTTDPWMSGCWNNNEGYYNFEMALVPKIRRMGSKTSASIYDTFEVILPVGIYKGVKFIIKRTTGVDGHGGDFKALLMETEALNFVIV